MVGDTTNSVSYYQAEPMPYKAPPHQPSPQLPYSPFNGSEANGIRPPPIRTQYLDSSEQLSPRAQLDPGHNWAPQRSPLDHRTALEPSLVHREIPHYATAPPGLQPAEYRGLHSSAPYGRQNSIHHTYVPPPPPLSREREGFDQRAYNPADRTLQVPQPPDPSSKTFPPQNQDYSYSQAGMSIPFSRPPGGNDFQRPYQPGFDPRPPGYPPQLERRHTTPHTPILGLQPETRRESHTPSGSSTTMSPPQDYGRTPSSQHPHYVTGIDTRQQGYNVHEVHHSGPHSDSLSPHTLTPTSRQPEFPLPRPHQNSMSMSPEQSGMLRSINQGYNPHIQSPGLISPKAENVYEPPTKRIRTEESGQLGGGSTDQDTEDEEGPNSEGHAGSGEADGKKRKYSGANNNRPLMHRKRSSGRLNYSDLDEDELPPFVDGVRVNKEWGLTKAGKARQRLPQACIACRKKKIKCIISKGQPVCEKCKQQGMICEFKSSTSSRSNKANSAAPPEIDNNHNDRKHEGSFTEETPARDVREDQQIVEAGEKQGRESGIDGMEYEMNHTRASSFPVQEDCNNIGHETTDIQPAPMFITDNMQTTLPSTANAQAAEAREALVREMAAQYQTAPRRHNSLSLPSNSTHMSSPSSPGSTEIISYGMSHRRFYSSTQSRATTTPLTGTPLISNIPGPIYNEPHELPSEEILTHLVNLYFSHVYSQHYPFLHKRNFMQNLMGHRPVLLFSLCAIAARFSDKYRSLEEQFTIQARQLILENFDEQKLEVVQALVLMGLHDFGSNNGQKAWMFAGMAVRLGAAMNLNMEPKDKGKTPLEIEVQRRTYWSYYLMDRLNSYGTSRPFLTQDHDCHIQLPCDQESFDNEREVITEHLLGKNPYHPDVGNQHMGAFAYLVRITSIWGDVLKYIHLSGQASIEKQLTFEPDQAFVDRLKSWDKSLPAKLRYSNDNLKQQIREGTVGAFVMMHVMYHTCAAYVYRYVTAGARPETGSKDIINNDFPKKYKDYIISSIQKIFVHVDSVMQIMTHVWQRKKEADKNGTEPVTVVAPFIGQAVSDACMISVIRAQLQSTSGAKNADAQRQRVYVGLAWLRELRKYWKPMSTMYDKLKKVIRQWERSFGKTTTHDSSSGGGSASVSPKQMVPMDHTFIPSPDSATHHMRSLPGGLVAYQSESPIEYSFDPNGDMLQSQYTHLSDLVYDVPFVYYVDALSGQGAINSLNQYAWDEGLYPNIFPEPTTGLVGPNVIATIGATDQQLATLNSGILTQSPAISNASSSTHHQYRSSNHHSNDTGSQHSPAPSPPSSPSSSSSDSDSEDDNDPEGPVTEEKNFGSRYFEPKNRMEILHCLNIDDEEVRKVVEAPEEDIIGGGKGDVAGGENEAAEELKQEGDGAMAGVETEIVN